jgi:hypothetical protein
MADMIAEEETRSCIYCGRSQTHRCAGDPVCDYCCQIRADIIFAVPRAEEWFKSVLYYHIRGLSSPEPKEFPWIEPERGPFHETLARRAGRKKTTLSHATKVFGNQHQAELWLKTRNPAFEGWTPGCVSATIKCFVLVEELLDRIDNNRRLDPDGLSTDGRTTDV